MDPSGSVREQEKKIRVLEEELGELRQGLTSVREFYNDISTAALKREVTAEINEEIVKPQIEEDGEFYCIWQFHEKLLIADPDGHVPLNHMYDMFVYFCVKTGREPVARAAFEFLLQQMDDPNPLIYRGRWHNCRLRTPAD
jgi:hypothetical protein